MSRKIKFRIRDFEENKFIDLQDAIITFDSYGLEIYKNNGMILEEYEINQYTGLKDANNVDVYEGDLIPYHFNEDVKGVVRYGEYKNPFDDEHANHIGFYVDVREQKYKNLLRKDLGFWLKISCVCGNIYEIN